MFFQSVVFFSADPRYANMSAVSQTDMLFSIFSTLLINVSILFFW